MKKINNSVVALLLILGVPNFMLAASLIDLGELGINASTNLNGNLNTNLNIGSSSVRTNTETNADIKTEATSTSSDGQSAGSETSLSSGIMLNAGETIKINRENVKAEAGAQAETDGAAIVNLTPQSVSTNANLSAFAKSRVKIDNNLDELIFTRDRVTVAYRQNGKMFAVVPITFTARVTIHADGSISVEYPWYSFLMVDNKETVMAELKESLESTIEARVQTQAEAEGGTQVKVQSFSAAESAEIAANIQTVLKANLEQTVDGDLQ